MRIKRNIKLYEKNSELCKKNLSVVRKKFSWVRKNFKLCERKIFKLNVVQGKINRVLQVKDKTKDYILSKNQSYFWDKQDHKYIVPISKGSTCRPVPWRRRLELW